MTIAWILCFLMVGVFLLAVAFGADVIAMRMRWPRRAVWSLVMIAMCVLPLLLRYITAPVPMSIYSGRPPEINARELSAVAPVVSPAREAERPMVTIDVPRTTASGNRALVTPDSPFVTLDRWALLAWIVATVVYAGLVLGAYRRMQRARRRWSEAPASISRDVAALTGQPTRVWCSDAVGPAAFGVARPAVVIPHWALNLEPAALDLLLRHEASHVTARDPLLLRVALAGVIAMPWNLPLLMAYRRLHRAVEHDCDARVIAETRDARGYGRLLIEIATRFADGGGAHAWSPGATWLAAPVPGIGVRRSELELRLRALAQPGTTWRSRVRLLAAALVMVAGLLAACAIPSPEHGGSTGRTTDVPLPSRGSPSTDASGGSSQRAMSVGDSVALYERLVTKLMPRAVLLQDSIIAAEARRLMPIAFDSTRRTDDDVWLLLDDKYHGVRANIGQQFYSVLVGPPEHNASFVAATASTPRQKLLSDPQAYARAFPGVRFDPVGFRAIARVQQGRHTVHIAWSRFVSLGDTRPVAAAADSGHRWSQFPWESRTALQNRAKMQEFLARAAAPYAAGLLEASPDETPVLWLLFDGNAAEVAHAVGRSGLFALREDRTIANPPLSNPATFMTPDNALGISCEAFAGKLPSTPLAARTNLCGMTHITSAQREIIVVFGVART